MNNIVIVNQAINYLTIGYANSFYEKCKNVAVITGSIHTQGEKLNDNIEITRIVKWQERPLHKKLLSYIIGSVQIYFLLLVKYIKYDVLFISLPPWAYLMKLLLPNRFSAIIWDVYPNVLLITGISNKNIIYKIWAFLNKKAFNKFYKIYTIGNNTANLLEQYISRDNINIIPIWSMFEKSEDKIPIENNKFIKLYNLENKFIVQYSGNIGFTHNVEFIVKLAEIMKNNTRIVFQIIGRGPKLIKIKKLVEEKDLINCQLFSFQSDEMFPHSISAANIGIVMLDEKVGKGSVPSKSYNLMSLGIPSLYIAPKTSELYEYANEYKHADCFTEGQIDDVVAFIEKLYNNNKIYKYYSKNALNASIHFKRTNADKLVHHYYNN